MKSNQIEIEELLRTAYIKGYAEARLDLAITEQNLNPDIRRVIEDRAKLLLEAIEKPLAEARTAGYFI